jgi:hypothetical protein
MIRPADLYCASPEEAWWVEQGRKQREKYGGNIWERAVPDLKHIDNPKKTSVGKAAPVDYTNVTNATDFNESLSDVGRTLVELESNYRFER